MGKSNIIKATRFAITGVFDNAGTKAENVCQLAGDKDRSRVVLDFEHEGTSRSRSSGSCGAQPAAAGSTAASRSTATTP